VAPVGGIRRKDCSLKRKEGTTEPESPGGEVAGSLFTSTQSRIDLKKTETPNESAHRKDKKGNQNSQHPVQKNKKGKTHTPWGRGTLKSGQAERSPRINRKV